MGLSLAQRKQGMSENLHMDPDGVARKRAVGGRGGEAQRWCSINVTFFPLLPFSILSFTKTSLLGAFSWDCSNFLITEVIIKYVPTYLLMRKVVLSHFTERKLRHINSNIESRRAGI